MYPFLPSGTARDAVASQFEHGEPVEIEIPARRRRNPLRAVIGYTGALATRATWSPTR